MAIAVAGEPVRAGSASGAAEAGHDVLALRTVGIVVAELDHLEATDRASARRLADSLLALLLGPAGRALLPHATGTVARILAGRLGNGGM